MINPSVAVKVCSYFSQMARGEFKIKAEKSKEHEFSKTELKIIQLIGMGLSNREIAEKMNFCEGTCRNYISEILNKTELRDRTQIAIFAVQSGLTFKLLDE